MKTEFERIVEEALEEARKVKCPIQHYLEGLYAMRDVLREEIDMVEGETE